MTKAQTSIKQRFDKLLQRMAHGAPASQMLAKGSATSTQATSEGSSDIHTHQGTNPDTSVTHARKSPDKRP